MKTLAIEHLSHDLRGVARADGSVWFVDGALPQEEVVVRESARHQNRIDAEVVEVVSTSPTRVVPSCEYATTCGGCSTQHISHDGQVAYKQDILREQLQRIGKLDHVDLLPPLVAAPWAYRRRTRIACKWLANRKHLAIGFRQRHSQDIVEINHCAVLVPVLQALLPDLRRCLSRWSQPRQLGHVELLAADNGVGMLVRVMAQPSADDAMRLQTLADKHDLAIFLQQDSKGNVQYFCGVDRHLLSRHTQTDTTLACVPGDFLQGNAVVNDLLVDAVLSALDLQKTDSVLEAFCGLGNFTLPLSHQVKAVFALELSAVMVDRARQHAVASGIANVTWLACDLEAEGSYGQSWLQADKILLDPPREGAQVFCRHVRLAGVERIVYVSCNPATLARDAAILSARGFSLQNASMVDMFPQTSHIEALAVFQRNTTSCKTDLRKAAKKNPAMKKLKR